MSATPEYDRIGRGYARNRRSDPHLAATIEAALGDARKVLNVGAGTGSYEPADRELTAVEPSGEMIAQRPPDAAPVVRATAEDLPFADGEFEAAMTVLSLHHWDDPERGVAEMRRVADRVVVLTLDGGDLGNGWMGEYMAPIATTDATRFPPIEAVAEWLGGASVEPVPLRADCEDLFLGALFARPELLLDPDVRASTSGFARLDDATEAALVDRLRADLESGAWDERYGDYRRLPELDIGLRLLRSAT